MSLCAFCGITDPSTEGDLCSHHTVGDADWSAANRIICDFNPPRQEARAPSGRDQHRSMTRVILSAAIVLTFSVESPCILDQAQVTFVPPASARVLVTEQCGGITCWTRYLVTEGKKVQESRACEAEHGADGSAIKQVGP